MKHLSIISLFIALAMLATGCQTTSQGSKTYTRSEAQKPLSVTYGTVISVAEVAGGVAGSTMGGGDGRKLATVAGVLIGAAIGSKAEQEMGKKNALEIEVEQDDGQILVVVQEMDDVFHPGDRVRIIESQYGKLRVRH